MSAPTTPEVPPKNGRLDSWKEIAAYLGRNERTVRRWEQSERLPVRRLMHDKKGSVYAYRAELDGWLLSRNPAPARGDRRRPALWTAAGVALLAAGLGVWLGTRNRPARTPITSIAVLPFDNLSHDQSQEWFSDGLTETLITELCKVRSLRVISRTSVMQYKNRTKLLKQIGSELGVDAVVEGSVLRVGDRVRITAQLISTSTDAHLWGRDFDRDIRDVLDLQKEVAGIIAQQVGATILPRKARPVNPDAMAAYLKGLYQFNRGDRKQAIGLARDAIRLDPEMSRAHELLAMALLISADFGDFRYGAIAPEARASIHRALELDPERRSPLGWLGWSYLIHEHDWIQAEKYLREGLDESEPSSAVNYSWILAMQGRHEEATRLVEQAVVRDPANPFLLTELARRYEDSRRYDDAIRFYRRAIDLDPTYSYPRAHLVFAFILAGREQEAFDILAENRRLAGSPIDWRGIYSSGGWPAVRRVILATRLPDTHNEFRAWHFILAGRRAEALDELELLEKGDSTGVMADLQYGIYDPIRGEPRFKALMKRVGYPQSMWR